MSKTNKQQIEKLIKDKEDYLANYPCPALAGLQSFLDKIEELEAVAANEVNYEQFS